MERALQGLLMETEYMMEITMGGQKHITIRKGHRDYTEGPVLIGFPEYNWCMEKTITKVRHTYLGEVTSKEYEADGCNSLDELKTMLNQFYPDLDFKDPVTVIYFD